jgi:hypothetical protein
MLLTTLAHKHDELVIDKYSFYHGFELKAFAEYHIRIYFKF